MDDITTPPPAAVGAATASVSAVSWGAIFAGTAVAAATSLLLFALFVGLDLAAQSRGAARGTPPSFTVMAAVALIAALTLLGHVRVGANKAGGTTPAATITVTSPATDGANMTSAATLSGAVQAASATVDTINGIVR